MFHIFFLKLVFSIHQHLLSTYHDLGTELRNLKAHSESSTSGRGTYLTSCNFSELRPGILDLPSAGLEGAGASLIQEEREGRRENSFIYFPGLRRKEM